MTGPVPGVACPVFRVTWRPDRSPPSPGLGRDLVVRAVVEGTEADLLEAAEMGELEADLADQDGKHVGRIEAHIVHGGYGGPRLVMGDAP